MRIGIWCDYGVTLGPTEGIGVFVDNLARGLVRASPECRVRLMAHPGQEEILNPTLRGGLGRIEVVAGIRQSKVRRSLEKMLAKLGKRLQKPNQFHAVVKKLDQSLGYLRTQITKASSQRIEELIQSCDVWLVPYVGLDQKFSKPTVVVIHDLVSYHFPDMLRPDKLEKLKAQVDRISNQSTIAACMSEFIRDNDLIGTLGLPSHRVRVIKAAVPADICRGVQERDDVPGDWLSQNGINGPYLFYPAAFRPYKNHRFLVDALHLLKQQSSTPMKLVFTGIERCPNILQQQIDHLDLTTDVVILGKVSREVLKQLYLNAFATVVPSLYEQGSFPVMEALASRCPVAASDIPSLREQFSSLESSMLYFDPYEPKTLVEVVNCIRNNREHIISKQGLGYKQFQQRTWVDAGKEWLDVFREAIRLQNPISRLREYQDVA